jgi:hypothetical protein
MKFLLERVRQSGASSSRVAGVIILLAFAILTAIFAATPSTISSPGVPSPKIASTNVGDLAVDVGNSTIAKLNSADGTVLWSASVTNDGALAVDPSDLGVYTGNGSHSFGGSGTVYKYSGSGALVWTNSITRSGTCNFYYVNNAAVDETSSSPGVVWTQGGCYGGIAGAQQWSVFTNDIGRASIDPANGQIYAITNNHYGTIYSATAGGSLTSASSCEGYTELNPADGMLYRGGNGCGTTLSQMNKNSLGATNWSMDLSGNIASFDAPAVQPWERRLHLCSRCKFFQDRRCRSWFGRVLHRDRRRSHSAGSLFLLSA